MGLQVVTGDARTTALTGSAGQDSQMMDDTLSKVWSDADGIVFEVGRGETQPLITYWASFNSNGVLCYTYPNAAGNGTITTTVKP